MNIEIFLDEYWALLKSIQASNASTFYKVMVYSVNQKEMLNVVLLDGRLKFINNLVKRT